MSRRKDSQWIAINPHPRTLMFGCGNPTCPWKSLGAYPCDDNDKRMGQLKTCPRCGWQGSFDMTTEKREEMKCKRLLFEKLMEQVQTECADFCLYL